MRLAFRIQIQTSAFLLERSRSTVDYRFRHGMTTGGSQEHFSYLSQQFCAPMHVHN